jgi:RimJ/RimL family protein N-acetyltransferase
MELTFNQWRIRSWDMRDASALAKYANNRNVWINLRDSFPFPYTEGDAKDWIRFSRSQKPESHFAIVTAEEAIGGIGVILQGDVHRLSAEIGYWLAEPFWGKGIAGEAVRIFTEYAFYNYDLVRIYAYVFDWNHASVKVLEKCGYALEGRLRKSIIKDRQIIDQFLYAIIRDDV